MHAPSARIFCVAGSKTAGRELLSSLRQIAARVAVEFLAEDVNGAVGEGDRRGQLRAFRGVADENRPDARDR